MQQFKELLKDYKFVSLWLSQILSQLSINILSFVMLIHLFEQTGSTIAASLLWVAYAVPAIIFGPVAAAFVDLLEKRKLLMVSNILQALVVVVFAVLLYRQHIYLSYTVVFLYSLFNQFYVPAEAAALPLLMKGSKLPFANSLFFITQQSSLVLGFAVAGIIDQVLGFRLTLVAVAICLFIAFISVSFLPEIKPTEKLPENFEKRFSKFFEQIIEGYKFIKGTHEVLLPFLLLLGVQVIFAVISINLPRLATDILMISPNSSGIAVVLPAGIGAIIGTLTIPNLISRGIRKWRIILVSLFLLSLSMVSAGLVVGFVALPFFVLTGMGAVGILVPSITYLQERTPKDLLGRVFGNFWFLTTLVTVLPVLFSATITDLLGIRVLLILLGGICFGVAGLAYKIKRV